MLDLYRFLPYTIAGKIIWGDVLPRGGEVSLMSGSELEKDQNNKQIFKHTLVQASAFLVAILCAILFFFVIFSYNTGL